MLSMNEPMTYLSNKTVAMEVLEERIEQVKLRAIDVFGSEAKAMRWINDPRPQFNGRSPLSVIDTDEGFDEVMCMLLRIAHGVYS